MKPANLTNIFLLPQNTQCSELWSKMSFLSWLGPKRAIFYGFGGRIWTHGVIWSPLCVTTLLVYHYPKVITFVSMTTKNKKHCKRHDGHDRALSTLTHITPSVQSRSFNKLWNLGRTSVRFCLAKFTKSTEWLTDNVRQWSNSGPILIIVTSLENPCINLDNFDIILQRAGRDWQGNLFVSVQLVPKIKMRSKIEFGLFWIRDKGI